MSYLDDTAVDLHRLIPQAMFPQKWLISGSNSTQCTGRFLGLVFC